MLYESPPSSSSSNGLHEDNWDWENEPIMKEVEVNGRRVEFHPEFAFGTAAVRGERELTSSTIAYWETICDHTFGTSIMFGLGDRAASMQTILQFTNLLGADCHSYGVNHQGLAFHGGVGFRLCDPIGPYGKNCAVGIFFDGPNKTISYFIDGEFVGTPFTEIDLSRPLYPMVSSTAQKSQFVVQNQFCWRQPASLFDLSLKSVYRTFPSNWSRLPLPRTILRNLEKVETSHRKFQRTMGRRRPRQSSMLRELRELRELLEHAQVP